MTFSRRAMLKLTGASSLAFLYPVQRLGASEGAKPFFLVFDDITANTPADALSALLMPFAMRGIPTAFLIKTGGDADPATPGGPVAEILCAYLHGNPDLGEAIAWVPDLADAPPYFQIRKANAARARLAAFLGLTNGHGPAMPPLLTIATWDRAGFPALDAVRAAGFRSAVLLSERSRSAASDRCQTKAACLRGTVNRAIGDGTYDIIAGVSAALVAGEMVVLTLSLAGISDLDPAILSARAEALAYALAADIGADRIFASLPRTHVFWFKVGSERLIGLHLDAPPDADLTAQVAFADFQTALQTAGIPFSLPAAQRDNGQIAAGLCRGIHTPGTPVPAGLPRIVTCAASPPPSLFGRLADAGCEVIVQPAGAVNLGMDENGLFHLAGNLTLDARAGPGRDIAAFGSAQDVVVSVAQSAYATPDTRAAIVGMLQAAKSTTPTTILDLPGFARAILPDDPVYRIMLATRRDLSGASTVTPALTGSARDALTEDARIAWSYVERMTDRATGLCPSTVDFEGGGASQYRVLTMWDLASQIQGTMAAHELGLITDAGFVSRTKLLLRALPAERIGGAMLPSSEISTANRTSVSHDYNACDTGRLLSALTDLNRHPLTKGSCTANVARWDLDRTLRNGRLNSVTGGRFTPLYQTHCAHYAVRAFARWGVTAASPYDDAFQGQSETDARMGLLYEVASIGPIGAEPLLLEALEMGFSPPSKYLADVLMTAQARTYASTGALIAASEGPLDRAPWFTYQGLRVDLGDDNWDVLSIDPAPAYKTEVFRKANRVLSTKAAFLWAATHPGAYSTALLAQIRAHARASKAGYSAGIYAETGTAMQDYSDINTNGIILQAIAYIQRGYAPRFPALP
jgi:hypothetical protein